MTVINSKVSFASKVIKSMLKRRYRVSKKTFMYAQLKNRQKADYLPDKGYDVLEIGNIIVYSRIKEHSKNHIVYLHGGAYILKGNKLHFSCIEEISDICDCTVHYIDYLIAPAHFAEEVVKTTLLGVVELMKMYTDHSFYIAGDSAGAGLALGVSKELGSFYKENEFKGHFLLSPWVDLSMTNKEIEEIEPHDVFFKRDELLLCAKEYAGDDLKHPLWSPLYADNSMLKDIIIYTGTNDLLYPDIVLFEQKNSVNTTVYVYNELTHVFALFPKTKERASFINTINETINYKSEN